MKFHDVTWSYDGDGTSLKLLTPNGVEYTDAPFAPYFYIREEDLTNELIRTAGDIDETTKFVPIEDYYQGELRRVEVTIPTACRQMRDAFEELGVETLQSDIPYARRVMIDLDWTVTAPDRMLAFDIEVAADDGFPDPQMAINRILTICAVDQEGQEFVFAHDDEKTTIENFLELAKDYKCVIGWNSLTFDWPYLLNRSDKLDIFFDDFKVVHLDALPIYRDALLIGQNSYKLEDVVAEEFENDYYDFEDVEYDKLTEYFQNDRDRLIEYNLEDVHAVRDLSERYQFKDIAFDLLASTGYCRPERLFYVRNDTGYAKVKKSSNALVEGVIINESTVKANDYPVIWPNKGSQSGESFTGAKVLEPKPGLHDNVILLDFSSMYPAIIEALNVGPETWRSGDQGDINAPIGSFVSEPESKFARSYRRVQKRRNEWKTRKKEAERGTSEYYVASAFDTGLKAYVNCFSPDHQVLTPDGIREITDLEVGDPVYSVNPETLETEIKPITDMYRDWYEGEMVVQDSANSNFRVTPNHRFLADEYTSENYKNDDINPSFNEIHELEDGRHIIPRGNPMPGKTPKYVKISDLIDEGTVKDGYYQFDKKFEKIPNKIETRNFLRLLGWVISEGTTQKERPYGLTICNKTPETREKIISDIERIGIGYREEFNGISVNGALGKVFDNICGEYSKEKYIPDFVFDYHGEDLKLLFDRLMEGDGRIVECNGHKRYDSYVTGSDQLREDICKLAVQIGNVPKTNGRDVRFLGNYRSKYDMIDSRNITREEYAGEIICPTVKDNHTVIAGREGLFSLTGQTFYGVLGSSYSRFYKRETAENITLMGQAMLQKTEELAESRGLTVLYGDTDSIILHIGDKENIVDYGHKLAASITEQMKQWVAEEYNADPHMIELTLDEVYERFFITDKKKRYAGICVWAGNPCETFEKKGFESVRGDWPVASQEFQDELLKRILQGEGAFDVIDDYKRRLFARELDDKIIKHVGLSKPPEDYDAIGPHVRVAMRHPDEFTAGDEIPYIKYGNSPEDVIRADTDDYREYLSHSAYRYIWEKNFKSIYERLGLKRHEQKQLGDY